ncbi:cytochrome P450 [Pseudonocardia broussonetiae]|uniref:Cytochrome P450 n=1 Tax=Pseudonocardia broussonetiae TaxID=2736640 RepID=A0A6M6JM69_9PSEU|nr:cytochrome P450 [Pseudonocardia broussonetiae]QJY48037.1 cytochrome P450 [Pseudonocardia broussonetiae]
MTTTDSPTPFSRPHPVSTSEDLSSDAFWHRSFEERDATFARLRRDAPVSWHLARHVPEIPADQVDAGFWAITRRDDITRISQDHETFSSDRHRGGVSFRSTDRAAAGPPTFLEMDPPSHTRYRQIMSAAFTPKAVARLSDKIGARAEQIVDRVVGGGAFDFVREVAAKLPMLTVADLVGVPESLVQDFARAGDEFVGGGDPDFLEPGADRAAHSLEQIGILRQIGVDLVDHRRRHPADDVATALAAFEIDGRPLTSDDIASVMLLLSVAGNDTTKQTTSRTVVSLWRHPDQRAWLTGDYPGRIAGSVEEFVRHASPVIQFARSVVRDVEIGGQRLEAGDKVVLFYCSGNRDEDVWPDAHAFDLSRERRPHVGFGGGGVHYCLGNGVAKAQLRALFGQILSKLPAMQVGEPEYLRSDFINGVKRLPVVVP